jgi:hypothetical protein
MKRTRKAGNRSRLLRTRQKSPRISRAKASGREHLKKRLAGQDSEKRRLSRKGRLSAGIPKQESGGEERESISKQAAGQIKLRSTESFSVDLSPPENMGQMASFWNYAIRNRQRYSEASRDTLCQQCQDELGELGVDKDALQELAERGLVEVSIPFQAENIGWEARIMPWESIFSLATKRWRKDRHPAVSEFVTSR